MEGFAGAEHVEAYVAADSVSTNGDRLTTVVVRFPRFVLAEFNTHRVFSRNSASSRAIPVATQLDMLFSHPFAPFVWTSEQPGMQGGDELEGEDLADAQELWSTCFDFVWNTVSNYVDDHPDKSRRLHKSLLNRMLEPWMWHTVVVTSSSWQNFFDQRCSELAQPEIRVAAEAIRDVLSASVPVEVFEEHNWHMPFVDDEELLVYNELDLLKLSVARCARVSYLNHDGTRVAEKDFGLFHRLADNGHWSPFEHVARPVSDNTNVLGNFDGWSQLRHEPLYLDSLRSDS